MKLSEFIKLAQEKLEKDGDLILFYGSEGMDGYYEEPVEEIELRKCQYSNRYYFLIK